MIDVYIAAPYCARDVLREKVVPEFEKRTYGITSGWLLGTRSINEGSIGSSEDRSIEQVMTAAQGDFNDVATADVVVAWTAKATKAMLLDDVPENWLHTGGRHTEIGYALALDIPVIMVGDPENVFQRAFCRQADTWQGALDQVSYLESQPPELWRHNPI